MIDRDQTFVLQNIAHLLHGYENDKNISNWTMEIQSKIQSTLFEKTENSSTKAEFLMDLFMLCIVVSSGCSTLVGNVDTIGSSRQNRLDAFPLALYLLCERNCWKDCSVRVSYIAANMLLCYNLRTPS